MFYMLPYFDKYITVKVKTRQSFRIQARISEIMSKMLALHAHIQKVLSERGPILATFFFCLMRGERIQIPL